MWPTYSPDLNWIENLCIIVNQAFNKGEKQYSANSELWQAIEAACKAKPSSKIKDLSKSINGRVAQVLKNLLGHIGH